MSTLEATYYNIKKSEEEDDRLQMELTLNLYNKGLEMIRSKEVHLEFDPRFIDTIVSVNVAG